jgi:hypothetical protein
MGDQGNFGAGQGNPLRPAMLIVGPGRGADVLLLESKIQCGEMMRYAEEPSDAVAGC